MEKTLVKIIAWIEILGGAVGILISTYSVLRYLGKPGHLSLISGVVDIVFVFSVFAGYMLYIDKKAGMVCSLLIQLIQIPQIFSNALIYLLFIGANVSVLVNSLGFRFGIFGGSMFKIYTNNSVPHFTIGINLIAVVLFVVLISCNVGSASEQAG